MNFWNSSKRWIWWCVWPVLAACSQYPPPSAPSLALDRGQAARLEQVRATTSGLSAAELRLSIGGQAARIVSRAGAEVVFEVPEAAPAGLQTVRVEAANTFAEAPLTIFGDDAEPDRVTVLLARELAQDELAKRLRAIDPAFTLERLRPLDESGALGSGGPCTGALAELAVNGVPLGAALEALEQLEQDDPGLILAIDPRSAPGVDAIDPLGAVGARAARLERGLTGAGTLIAILDTGVSPHPELTGRLRLDLAYDALTGGSDVSDGYSANAEGHGTPAAVLAAGSTLGVAPGAEVLPVKVCDDGGTCLSSDVVLGSCYALAAAQREGKLERLVLSYSLGGETEIGAVTAVLRYALEQGALVVAAGGNQGDPRQFPQPAPRHYPAASALPGLLAVGALSAGEAPACVTFEGVPNVGSEVTYAVGERFEEGGATVSLSAFTLRDGSSYQDGSAYADFGLVAGGSGQALWTGSVLASFDFGGAVGGVTLRFADYGGSENLLLNGQLFNLSALDELPASSGTVSLSVSGAGASGQGAGELTVQGALTDFGVGGQAFAIDDVCPVWGAEADWQPALFGTRGDYLDIAAPGDGVTSGAPGGTLAVYSGTSFATPLVAGALALWREAGPNLSPAEVEAGLKAAARALPYSTAAVGAGMLDVSAEP